MENGIHEEMPDNWDGKERRTTCLIHHDTIQAIYDKLVSWKVFVFVVAMAAGGVSATNIWVQSTVRDTRAEITASFKEMKGEFEKSGAVLHRRITEGNEERTASIEKLNQTLNRVSENLRVLDWRMTTVEDQLKVKPPDNGRRKNP